MMEQRPFGFGSIPVYNPQSLSKDEALAQFFARRATYSNLLNILHEKHPSHILIIGTRGMGKTTLLQRVRYGVEDDAALSGRYVVLVFPEEQYNVNRLHHFLLNTIDALADAMERAKNHEMLKIVEKHAGTIAECTPEEIEDRVPRFLAEIATQLQRSFLLLVDNADRLFETIEGRQQWQLRDMLSSRRDITFFGATTQASEGIYGNDRAFFEFFRIVELTPLKLGEVRDLLLQLSDAVQEEEGQKGTAKRRVVQWLEADAARLPTLVQLTGGNPRTTVLLFHLVLDGLAGGAREYLEQLLDQVTPNYKGRVDELPSQAQQVLDAVALQWDPITAMEVARETKLETSAVSTHLTRLVRQGILEKADPGDSKKAMYQVAERFFNIWYLMRASRRVRAKLRWFVEFLRVFFDSGRLDEIAKSMIQRSQRSWRRHPEELETAFAYVLASGAERNRIEDFLRQECSDSEEIWRPYLDLIPAATCGSDAIAVGNSATELRTAADAEPENAGHWVQLGDSLCKSPDRYEEAEFAYGRAIKLDPTNARFRDKLGDLLAKTPERFAEAETSYREAIERDPGVAEFWADLGHLLLSVPERLTEAEAAVRKAIELESDSAKYWALLAVILAGNRQRITEAEAACRKAIALRPTLHPCWQLLAHLLSHIPGRFSDAEAAYRQAIELDPRCAGCWSGLGRLLTDIPERFAEVEAACRNAIELEPRAAEYWGELGRLLTKIPERFTEAEAAYRNAIELEPKAAEYWGGLGDLLAAYPERLQDAEEAYRTAIKLSPKNMRLNDVLLWSKLSVALVTSGRTSEAEVACREGIKTDPTFAGLWALLGSMLSATRERFTEAEEAYRKAIELDPNIAWFWDALGNLIANTPDTSERFSKAEGSYRRAIALAPTDAGFWQHLGGILADVPERFSEAEEAYRKAIALDPSDYGPLGSLAFFLACKANRPKEAEVAFRNALRIAPDDPRINRNLGVLVYCELDQPEAAIALLRHAHELQPKDPLSSAILAASQRDSSAMPETLIGEAYRAEFWRELLELCNNYPPFGKILLRVCEMFLEQDSSNAFATLHRAVALAQVRDFPRASVALEDALIVDPIESLLNGRQALEVFMAAAVRSGRVQDCLELIDRKGWRDAWRPFYEALNAVRAGSADYLKRIAVEIRQPALLILRNIAPRLPDLPSRIGSAREVQL